MSGLNTLLCNIQEYHDHLETELTSILDANRSQWQKIDFQLYVV